MKKAKYLVFINESFYKYKNDIFTFEKRVLMDMEYGIYTYSLADALTFLKIELIAYFTKNNLKDMCISKRKDLLYAFFSKFNIYDLTTKKYLNHADRYSNSFWNLEFEKIGCEYFYSKERVVYIHSAYDIVSEIAEWNGLNPYYLAYLYPVLTIDRENEHFKYQHRSRFHTKCYNYLALTKREAIAGSDPEYKQFLTMRQRHRDSCLNYSGYRKNRNNVPGDWKHYNKCRKQWAKNIENPSYEKISKAVWKQELKMEEPV